MLANGSDWSSLVRTISHGCGPMRGGVMLTFMVSSGCRGFVAVVPAGRGPIFTDERNLKACASTRQVGGYGPPLSRGRHQEALSYRTISERHAAAGLRNRLAGELYVGDLFDRGLLFGLDVAIFDRVLDRPFGALGIEAL